MCVVRLCAAGGSLEVRWRFAGGYNRHIAHRIPPVCLAESSRETPLAVLTRCEVRRGSVCVLHIAQVEFACHFNQSYLNLERSGRSCERSAEVGRVRPSSPSLEPVARTGLVRTSRKNTGTHNVPSAMYPRSFGSLIASVPV